MVEDGIASTDDLKSRIVQLSVERDTARSALELAKAQQAPALDIAQEAVERFGRAMREHLRTGEVPFRRAYLRSRID